MAGECDGRVWREIWQENVKAVVEGDGRDLLLVKM